PLGEELIGEQVPVGVALRVVAGPGVAVPVPGAAHAAARLHQLGRVARRTGQVQLVDAGYPGPHDEDVDVRVQLLAHWLAPCPIGRAVQSCTTIGLVAVEASSGSTPFSRP